jgi:putative phosphoesterase
MPLLGIISDTHGLLRPEAVVALRGVDRILHAGDVGGDGILRELATLAPVTAVRGNMDKGDFGSTLPATEAVEVGGAWFYIIHDLETLDLNPSAAGFHAVVFGHTHLPEIRNTDGVRYINPGSAGPERPGKPVTVAVAEVEGGEVRPRIVRLL